MITAADIYHHDIFHDEKFIGSHCIINVLPLLKHMQAQVNFVWNLNSELNHSGKCVVMFMFISNVLGHIYIT